MPQSLLLSCLSEPKCCPERNATPVTGITNSRCPVLGNCDRACRPSSAAARVSLLDATTVLRGPALIVLLMVWSCFTFGCTPGCSVRRRVLLRLCGPVRWISGSQERVIGCECAYWAGCGVRSLETHGDQATAAAPHPAGPVLDVVDVLSRPPRRL